MDGPLRSRGQRIDDQLQDRRYDFQGVSDEAEMDAVRARVPGMALTR